MKYTYLEIQLFEMSCVKQIYLCRYSSRKSSFVNINGKIN